MAKRCLDLLLALAAIIILWPFLVLAALGIMISDPGPIIYRARRVGRNGRVFIMYKLRTMRVATTAGAAITAHEDPRIFRFGTILRATKIDELPQVLNIIKGEMSVVGPRPESEEIVEAYFSEAHRACLTVAPGLTSPGTLYYVANGQLTIGSTDPVKDYVENQLPLKIALDMVYINQQSALYDIRLIGRTLRVLLADLVGMHDKTPPPEMHHVKPYLDAIKNSSARTANPIG